MNPNTVGYCAVVMPTLDHYQAYFIVDDEGMRANAVAMQVTAMMAIGEADPFGTLQAAFAEAALENNQTAVGAAALALKGVAQASYFYVLAEKEPMGTRTSLHKLDATNVDSARRMIENLPEVLEIKRRLLSKLSMRDGGGRKKAFH